MLPSIALDACGGQNCGIRAISAGLDHGRPAGPGPCGSSAVDPVTNQVDYSHSYGLFQSTPACDGVFGLTTSLSGHTCTATTEADDIPFSMGNAIDFYCESATSTMSGGPFYIDAVQDTTSPLYAMSGLNPAYQIYVYFDQWADNFAQANMSASGCTMVQGWYLTLAYWLTGTPSPTCTLTGNGLSYVQGAIADYKTLWHKQTWPYAALLRPASVALAFATGPPLRAECRNASLDHYSPDAAPASLSTISRTRASPRLHAGTRMSSTMNKATDHTPVIAALRRPNAAASLRATAISPAVVATVRNAQ